MPEKLYCYVDETGQDTRGRLFIVGVVVTSEENERYRALCEAIEGESGKGKAKWLKAGYTRKLDYIGRVLHEPLFAGRLFFAVYQDAQEYYTLTVKTIAAALKSLASESAETTVLIDALPWSLERQTATQLRQAGLHVRKVRGPSDESEPLIRLADSLCGFARAAHDGEEDMQELLDWAIRAGVLRDLT